MKLSELLKLAEEKGLKVEDLTDDETGVSFRDLRGRFAKFDDLSKENDKYKKDLETKSNELNQAQQSLSQFRQQLEQGHDRALRQGSQPGATQAQIDRAYRSDALYANLVPYLDHLENAISVIGNVVQASISQYQANQQWLHNHLNKQEVHRLKGAYTDFDEEKVRAVAKKHGLNDWEGAYKLWREESEPDRINKIKEETRLATIKELEEKTKQPPVTEMGGGTPAAIPPGPTSGGEGQDYNQSWKGLVDEIKGLGF